EVTVAVERQDRRAPSLLHAKTNEPAGKPRHAPCGLAPRSAPLAEHRRRAVGPHLLGPPQSLRDIHVHLPRALIRDTLSPAQFVSRQKFRAPLVPRTSAPPARVDPGPSARLAAKPLNIAPLRGESCAGSRLCARSARLARTRDSSIWTETFGIAGARGAA